MADKPLILTADAAGLDAAARLLAEGGLVALPTETVYGLGADAANDKAVARIFEAKGRPSFNPLIIHVPDAEAARVLVRFDARAERLAARFWPGPLTLVLPRRDGCPVSWLAGAGLETLAVRVPAHPVMQAVLARVGRPIAAPSANRSGRLSPTLAAHVLAELGGRIDAVLDGGSCPVGVESTVLDLTGPEPLLLRPGGVPRGAIEALIGPLGTPPAEGVLRGPGLLASHYAPALPLRLNAAAAQPGEALLAFGPNPLQGAAVTLNLSEAGDLTEAAARLFGALRALDRPGLTAIAVMPIPDEGLGEAINDRLRRAAAPR
jgi:L-threonylcarbamoyladenylate synthase